GREPGGSPPLPNGVRPATRTSVAPEAVAERAQCGSTTKAVLRSREASAKLRSARAPVPPGLTMKSRNSGASQQEYPVTYLTLVGEAATRASMSHWVIRLMTRAQFGLMALSVSYRTITCWAQSQALRNPATESRRDLLSCARCPGSR